LALIDVINMDFSVGGPLLLERVNLTVEPRERICIVGRNGAGKSTLLKLLAQSIKPDDGQVRVNCKIATLAQEVPSDIAGTIEEVIDSGLGELGAAIARFHYLSHHLDQPGASDEFAEVQHILDTQNGWALEARVSQVLTRLELDGELMFAGLSGGMKRRVLLAQALVSEPDVLLLDEPTNHLDVSAIQWLEEFLKSAPFSCVFVTHDRSFLRALATRIVEIDRGQVSSWPGDYDNFLRRKEERLHAEAQENALFDKKLASEEVWIRQGIKARRTRNEGRVTALKQLRTERSQRRDLQGNVRLATAMSDASGKRVVDAEGADFSFGNKVIIKNLTTTILRGDRVGLIGPNGSGKTTLLKLLLGELAPTAGKINQGSNLQVAYFDQLRAALNEDLNALDNVAEGREFVEINGARKHILGYLQDFLFTPERARAPITRLSGGERNRLLLAKLFLKPANILVLDEPTNDLDVETLDLLEELLADYKGTVILVSHDREFLDNVVSSSLVLEGGGSVIEVAGGYSDWLRERQRGASFNAGGAPAGRSKTGNTSAKASTAAPPPIAAAAPIKRKLNFNDQRELTELPKKIELLEIRQAGLTALLGDPAAMKKAGTNAQTISVELHKLGSELDTAFARWAQLDA
jgi:ABC transport system ATP-binding/permease protein